MRENGGRSGEGLGRGMEGEGGDDERRNEGIVLEVFGATKQPCDIFFFFRTRGKIRNLFAAL
jgi:hypothetical protein